MGKENIDNSSPLPEPGLQAVSDLVDLAGRLQASSVIIPGGSRLEDLQLTDAARDNGIIDRIILVGKQEQVHQAVEASGMDIAPQDIVAVENDEAVAQATVAHMRQGDVDIVLKGDISTPILNRAMLPLAERSTVSLVSIFDAAPIAKGRPVILTDAGVTTVCNLGRMIDLIHNAVDVAQVVMNVARPRVAVLSANEKQIPSLPSTWMGLELARREWDNAVVCGPLSFDLATSEQSVRVKGMPDLPGASEVAGQADILVCPGIDAANILYKALTAMTRYGQASIAGITVGFPIPYIILSRADALETRLDSIALCSIYAQKRAEMKRNAAATHLVSTPSARRVLAVGWEDQAVQLSVFEDNRRAQDVSVPIEANSPQAICQTIQERGIGPLDAVVTRAGKPGVEDTDSLHDAVYTMKPGIKYKNSDAGVQLAEVLAQHYQAAGFVLESTRQRLCMRAAVRRAAQSSGRQVDQVSLVLAQLGPERVIAGVRQGRIMYSKSTWSGSQGEAGSTDSNALHTCIREQGWADIEKRLAAGDPVLQSLGRDMTLQIAQEIGGAFVALDCIVEAIVLAGEWMQSAFLRNALRKRVARLAPVQVYQGAMDMEGLAGDAQDVLSGRVQTELMTG